MKKLEVDLGARSYPIMIGANLFEKADAWKNFAGRNCVIISDDQVAALYREKLENALKNAGLAIKHAAIAPAGESAKSFQRLMEICEEILSHAIDRKTLIIALGGGVIGDLAGFTAAILLRGIPFVQIPTTLLAQVDSSVGGKTGINSAHGKNLIGAFYQPQMVIADIAMLETLPDRQMRAGYAEIVKYGLINDASFFKWCEENGTKVLARDAEALEYAVHYSCHAKGVIVGRDEREETGLRALLNLGHTFGHAFEAESGFSDKLLHGEAVAMGIVEAFRLSVQLGLCPENDLQRVRSHFQSVGMETDWRVHSFAPEKLIDHMMKDKKAENSQLNFILADGIGKCRVVKNVDAATVRQLLEMESV